MTTERRARLEARATIIKAMAHATRLCLVEELARGERCVGDLTDLIGDDVSTVSRHLAVLRQAGIVSDHKRGLQVYYRLRMPCILNFFTCVEKVLAENARQHQALLASSLPSPSKRPSRKLPMA